MKYILILPVIAFLLSSCNEEPTGLGFQLDTMNVDYLNSETDAIILGGDSKTTYLSTLFNNSFHFIGRHEDAEAISFYRFARPDSGLGGVQVISAKLRMYPTRYAYGGADTAAGDQSFDLYKINEPFRTRFTWDSVFNAPNSANFFDKSKKLGFFSGNIPLGDTMDPIDIDFDAQMVKEWFEFRDNEYKYDSTSKEKLSSYQFALLPSSSSTFITRFMNANAANTVPPQITVIHTNPANSADLDTTILDCAIMSSYMNAETPPADKIVLQGGVSSRGRLTFDVRAIPKYASIVRAQLEITFDRENSQWGNALADSVVTATYLYGLYDTPSISSWINYQTEVDSTGKAVFPSIASAVEYWNRRDGIGDLILFRHKDGNEINESRYLDKLSFYGFNHPDPAKRPKLTIFYTKRPRS